MELVVTNDRGSKTILLEDVIFFEAFGDDCFCVTNDNKYKVRMKLYDTEDFAPNGFVRINKSFVVNVFKVITLTPQINSKLKIRMKNQEVLFVNRSFMKHFKGYLKRGEYRQ